MIRYQEFRRTACSLLAVVLHVTVAASQQHVRLFPPELGRLEWLEFEAQRYPDRVCGMIFDQQNQTDCGLGLGGISTGCLDLEVSGTIGFDSILQGYPRNLQRFEPFIGLSVGGKTWVLASEEIIQGGIREGTYEPGYDPSSGQRKWDIYMPGIDGVKAAKRIHYFGHFPIVDYEFETDAPVELGLRAWAPFVPGDVATSSVPAIVFEAQLRNLTEKTQTGTIAFNYPGEQLQTEVNTKWVQRENSGNLGEHIWHEGEAPFNGKVLAEKDPRLGRPHPKVRTRDLSDETPHARPLDKYPLQVGGRMIVGDPSGDGRNEIVVALRDKVTRRGLLVSWQRTGDTLGGSMDGSGEYEFEIIDILDNNGFTAIELGDVDNDGRIDLLAGTLKGEVFVYNRISTRFLAGNTEPLKGYGRKLVNEGREVGGIVTDLGIGDVDGDSSSEVVYTTFTNANASSNEHIPGAYLVDGDLHTAIVQQERSQFLGCAVGDFNKDGHLEIAVGSKSVCQDENYVQTFAIDPAGRIKKQEIAILLAKNEGPNWLVTGDFDGNGQDDLLVGTETFGTLWIQRIEGPRGKPATWGREVAASQDFVGYSQVHKPFAGDSKSYIAVGAQGTMLLGRLNGGQDPAGQRGEWGLERYFLGPRAQEIPSSTALPAMALGDLSGDGVIDVITFQAITESPESWTAKGKIFGSTIEAFDVPRPRTNRRWTESRPESMCVATAAGKQYAVTLLDGQHGRFGGSLGRKSTGWAHLDQELPVADESDMGISTAVDFEIKPGECKTVRFALSWYVPEFGTKYAFKRMNMLRYDGVMDVARQMHGSHRSFLQRIIGWQSAVYRSQYPIWLKDALVNTLSLIPEDSYWAASREPLGDWCFPGGLFGMIESPRAAPQTECIPCTWYGNIPIFNFFPELMHSTLKGFKQYQRSDGAMAFNFASGEDLWAPGDHGADNQIVLNGFCFIDMVHRQWLRTGDDAVVDEFYPAVKAATDFAMKIRPPQYGMMHMPIFGSATEWWEGWEWAGLTPHAGGINLAGLLMVEQMAKKYGDDAFARRCRKWFEHGQDVLEDNLWDKNTYLLFKVPATGKAVDDIMANQFDAEWISYYHGLDRVFDPTRFGMGLDTIARSCIVENRGAVAFATAGGEPKLTAYGNFIPEMFLLAMTYYYAGDDENGDRVAMGCLNNLYKNRRIPFNWPNHIRADTGERTYGSDYYQNMIVWSIPAAMDGHDIAAAAADGEFFDKIIRAGRVQEKNLSDRPKVPGAAPTTVPEYVPPTVPKVEKRSK